MSDHKIGEKMVIFKIEYPQNYSVSFHITNIVDFKVRCGKHLPNLKTVWNIDFLTVTEPWNDPKTIGLN